MQEFQSYSLYRQCQHNYAQIDSPHTYMSVLWLKFPNPGPKITILAQVWNTGNHCFCGFFNLNFASSLTFTRSPFSLSKYVHCQRVSLAWWLIPFLSFIFWTCWSVIQKAMDTATVLHRDICQTLW